MGTGIGLHLTQEFIKMHHGQIVVDSVPNEYTLFTVELQKGKDHLIDCCSVEQPDVLYNSVTDTMNVELQDDIEKKIQIDEMRKEFLSNVSHELKTPLALIQGYAEGLQECINDDAESREFYCEVIVDEADKMNKMVKK